MKPLKGDYIFDELKDLLKKNIKICKEE